MARPRTGRRYMASLPRDDSQGRTSGILGICRKTPRTEDQAKILTPKTDPKLQENPPNRRTPNADCGERPYADQTHRLICIPEQGVKQNALMDQNNPETRSRKVPGSRDLGPKIRQNDARQTRGIVQDAARGSRGGRPVRAVEPRSPRGRTAKPNKSKSCQKVETCQIWSVPKNGRTSKFPTGSVRQERQA